MALDVCINIGAIFSLLGLNTVFTQAEPCGDTNLHIFFTILYLAESGIRLINADGLAIVSTY